VARLTARDALLFFSVPFVDRSGTVIERRAAAVKISGALTKTSSCRALIAGATDAAARAVVPRACRLEKVRHREQILLTTRTRAIVDDLLQRHAVREAQAGLFDRRWMEPLEAHAHELADLQRDHRRATDLFDEADVRVGTPVLALAVGMVRR
jgi:hypothetical protein